MTEDDMNYIKEAKQSYLKILEDELYEMIQTEIKIRCKKSDEWTVYVELPEAVVQKLEEDGLEVVSESTKCTIRW